MVEARRPVLARVRAALVDLCVARANRHVGVAVRTYARVRVHALDASTAVQARPTTALIRVGLADQAHEARDASAQVEIETHRDLPLHTRSARIRARAAVHARTRRTLVHILGAIEASIPSNAGATVLEDEIVARRAVQTRVRCTLVQVLLTVVTATAIRTHARVLRVAGSERARAVDARREVLARPRTALLNVRARFAAIRGLVARIAEALVQARAGGETLRLVRVAVVSVLVAAMPCVFAELPRRSLGACAHVRVDEVGARAAILARSRGAFVQVDFAVVARVAARAHARVLVHVVEARRTMQARRRTAFIKLRVTRADRHVSVSPGTRARVRVNRLLARTAVLTRIRRALVNIGFTHVLRTSQAAGVPRSARALERVGQHLSAPL